MRKILKFIVGTLTLSAISLTLITMFATHKKLKIAQNDSTIIYQPGITTLNFPLYISVDDIEQVANLKIKKQLVNKTLPMKNKKDSLHLSITRLDNLDIQLRDGRFHTKVPLKLKISVNKHLVGKARLHLFEEKPLELYVTACLKSDFHLKEDMTLATNSRFEELHWDKEPTATIAGIEFDLKDKINQSIAENAGSLTHKIDSIIGKKVNLIKPIRKIWHNLQKSLKASKKQEDLFIRIQPQAVGVHIDKSMDDSIKLDMVVTSKIFIRFAEDTLDISKVKFPNKITLLKKKDLKDFSQFYIHALLPLKRVNQMLRKNLEGKEFHSNNLDLKIKKILVVNGQDNMYVRVKHGGTLSGTVVLRGFPSLSADHKKLEIKNVSFENQLEDEVMNSMTDLLHSEIIDIMHDYTSYDVGEILQSLPEFARKGLSRTKFAQRVAIDLQELKIETMDVKLTRDNIQLLISGRGIFDVSLKKNSFKVLRDKNLKGKRISN